MLQAISVASTTHREWMAWRPRESNNLTRAPRAYWLPRRAELGTVLKLQNPAISLPAASARCCIRNGFKIPDTIIQHGIWDLRSVCATVSAARRDPSP